MPTNAERAGRIVSARRKELDLNQLEVQAAGGPSNSKQTEIENGRLDELSSNMAKKLDRGLRWEPGSARRVWAGGDPTPTSTSPIDVVALGMLLEHADDEMRRRILAILAGESEFETGDSTSETA